MQQQRATCCARSQNLTQINVGRTSNGFPVTVTVLVEKPRAVLTPNIETLRPHGWAAFFLTLARRIAANIAKLPELTALWLKVKNPNAPAVRREAEEDWGR